MKKHAWWGVGLCLSFGLAACGGSEGDDLPAGHDAGIVDYSEELERLRNQLNELGPQLDQLTMRTTALETPKDPGSCSAGELCIPDGVNLAQVGLAPMIKALCTYETTCCNAGELNFLYGPAVKSVADCEAAFASLIGRGLTSTEGLLGEYVEGIVRVAHALNDTEVQVEVDGTAVAACAAEISGTPCRRDVPEAKGCTPEVQEGEGACSLGKLLKGKEREGDTCEPGAVNECGPGLICRLAVGDDANRQGQTGICAPKAAPGDRCLRQADCDDLYCDFASGTCKAYATEGQPCAYIDPTFEDLDPILDEGHFTDGSRTSIDCAPGLSCNPLTNTCVKRACAAGSWCNDDEHCGAGLSCNYKANATLEAYRASRGRIGVCTPSGIACQSDYDCGSGRCGPNGQCAPRCDCDDEGQCTCGAGTYCLYFDLYANWCEPLLATGSECTIVGHASCASGFCLNGFCAEKVASGGSCASVEQCPANEACQGDTCVPAVGIGSACSPLNEWNSNCAAGSYCWDVHNDGSEGRCYKLGSDNDSLRALPDGIYCMAPEGDLWCASGWCRLDGTRSGWFCAPPLADGVACNPQDPSTSRCGKESYCKVGSASADAGVCTPYAQPGEPCDPARDGEECHGEQGGCVLRNERFVCAPWTASAPFCRAIEG